MNLSIVNLWIVLDGVLSMLIAPAQLLSGINPPWLEERYMFCVIFFFVCFFLQAILLSPPPPPPLPSVFVCLSKAYSYSLPTVLCNLNLSWLPTNVTDEKRPFM